MTPARLKALRFIAEHPGGTATPAFPCGYAWRFDAPELKRAPFRTSTLYALLDDGLIVVTGTRGVVSVTKAGRAVLEERKASAK